MANEKLEQVRGQLTDIKDLYTLDVNANDLPGDMDESDLQSTVSDLEDALTNQYGEDGRDTFNNAVDSVGGGTSLSEAMTNAAEEVGIAQEFRSTWANSDEIQMLERAIANIANNAWGQAGIEARDVVRQAAMDADLDTLNKQCSLGNFDNVEEEFGGDAIEAVIGSTNINSYTDCVTVTGELSGVKEDLMDKYGTSG